MGNEREVAKRPPLDVLGLGDSDLFSCEICCDLYESAMVLVPCGHSYCGSCARYAVHFVNFVFCDRKCLNIFSSCTYRYKCLNEWVYIFRFVQLYAIPFLNLWFKIERISYSWPNYLLIALITDFFFSWLNICCQQFYVQMCQMSSCYQSEITKLYRARYHCTFTHALPRLLSRRTTWSGIKILPINALPLFFVCLCCIFPRIAQY